MKNSIVLLVYLTLVLNLAVRGQPVDRVRLNNEQDQAATVTGRATEQPTETPSNSEPTPTDVLPTEEATQNYDATATQYAAESTATPDPCSWYDVDWDNPPPIETIEAIPTPNPSCAIVIP